MRPATGMTSGERCGECGATLAFVTADGRCASCQLKRTQIVPGGSAAPGGPAAGTRFGDYELVDRIAEGGMGVVWRARHVKLDRVVALKMTLLGRFAGPEDVQRFLIEAAAAAALDHPNIVPIYEVGEQEGRHYFCMKLVEGKSLADELPRLRRRRAEAVRLLSIVSRAIHFAHSRGILHRDLKPANVLLDADRKPFVTDFGLAKRIESMSKLTQTGFAMGTPSYMSPEQAQGERGLTTGTDVWSLGVILFEAVTGALPFVADSPAEVLRRAVDDDPPRPSSLDRSIDRDLETIVLKCLEKDPARRYGSAEALADDLDAWSSGLPIRARPVSTVERIVKWARRRRLQAALVAVSLLAFFVLLAAGAVFNRRLDRELGRSLEARRELQRVLARALAERLDADFRRLSGIPQAMAGLLSHRADWSEPQLAGSLLEALHADRRIYGACIAFEPRRFAPDREHFALYVHRTAAGHAFLQLLPPGYTPIYLEWPWYASPRKSGRAVWSDPYFDEGGGQVWMSTHSAPFSRDDRFAGVVTVDVSLDESRRVLSGWLEELKLGEGAYVSLADANGLLLSHPDPKAFRKRVGDLLPPADAPGLDRELAARRDAVIRGRDPRSGRPCAHYAFRVPSAGWTLIATVPEPGR